MSGLANSVEEPEKFESYVKKLQKLFDSEEESCIYVGAYVGEDGVYDYPDENWTEVYDRINNCSEFTPEEKKALCDALEKYIDDYEGWELNDDYD